MSEAERIESAFTSVQDEQLPELRSVSGLAVAALVLGIVSAGAVAVPLMWVVAAAGVAVAGVALGSIAKDPGRKLGRSAAVAGMVLSLLFASWGVSNYLTRQRLIYRQAEEFAQRWLQMVLDGKLREAHQLTIPQSERHAPETDLVKFYEANEERRFAYDDFWKQSPLSALIELPENASCRLVGDERMETDRDSSGRTESVTLQFEVQYERDGRLQRLPVQMVMARTRERYSGEASWRVAAVNPVRDRSG